MKPTNNTKFIEFYEIIGSGSFGTVYRAKIKNINKICACKVLKYDPIMDLFEINPDTYFESFTRELAAYNELNSNYIIKIYGSHISKIHGEQNFYLIMEYMEKGSLTNLLSNERDLPYRKRLQIACNIASGLRRIHEKGFIHRDIRPDNIFVNQHYIAKIGDMGLAKLLQNPQKNSIVGCSKYMPNEFYSRNYDQKLDLFTFGLTLYHLFSGQTHSYDSYEIKLPDKSAFFSELIDNICI